MDNQEFVDRVERWQSAEPGELAQNFHALVPQPTNSIDGPANLQFVKATSFPIEDLTLLQDVSATVQSIRIWMTMRQFDKTSIGFEPILEVYYLDKDAKAQTLLLGSDTNNLTLGGSEPVPLPFVKNTTQLWKELESENLPGVFDVRTSTGSIERVHFYDVSGIGLDLIKLLLPHATNMNILPGLDLNKSVNSDNTIFIPIIQLQVPAIKDIELTALSDNHLTGLHWHLRDDDDDDAFFDFARPCPPLCPPPDDSILL